jgi:membrane associated rhomboid family serine protease
MAFPQNDRGDYRPQFGGFSFFPPVIKYMILANVAAFFLKSMLAGGFLTVGGESMGGWFEKTFYLCPIGEGFRPWQLVSYMFLHGDFYHIFFNMLMLWMFGMGVENTWGTSKFLAFYFACGIAAGLSNLFIAPMFIEPARTIGASGSVYGVLVAFAMLFPNRYVFIYFLLPVKAKYLVTIFVGLELFYGITGSSEGIAHMAHLGGAVLAAVWVILDSRGVIDRWFSKLSSSRRAPSIHRMPPPQSSIRDAVYSEPKTPPAQTPRNEEFERYQKVIDEILDKIGRTGYSSLTEDEKRILLEASKKIHPDKGASN